MIFPVIIVEVVNSHDPGGATYHLRGDIVKLRGCLTDTQAVILDPASFAQHA